MAVEFSSATQICLPITKFDLFSKPGYALPLRKHSRHKNAQKEFVLKCFLRSEKSGAKPTAEEISSAMRASGEFETIDFLSSKQIKSLLSQFTQRLKKSGKIAEDLFKENESDSEQNENIVDDELLDNEVTEYLKIAQRATRQSKNNKKNYSI